jgi:hypothetical protein
MRSQQHLRKGTLALLMITMTPVQLRAEGVYVTGVVDCATWVQSRSQKTSQILETYVVGVMNGLALGSGVEFWYSTGSKLEPGQVHLWMDKYCRENPLNSVVTGTIALMNEHTGAAYKQSHD